MIRKILRWIGIMLGSLIGLLILAFVVLYAIGPVKWNKLHGKYEVPDALAWPALFQAWYSGDVRRRPAYAEVKQIEQ